MRQEHADMVVEEVNRNHKPMRGGVLQYHGGRRGGVHRGTGYIQVSGEEAILSILRLANGPPEYQEGAPSLGTVRKANTEGDVGSVSVRENLLVSGTVSVTLWGRDLGVVGGNGQDTGWGPCGFP